MAASTAVVPAPSQLPALVQTPALEIEAQDVVLPRIYFGQFSSKAVQQKLVNAGDIYAAEGQEDADPQVLYQLGADEKTGPVFYVLGMKKGKSFSEPGGDLEIYDYDDPTAPDKAWVTYNYFVAIPDLDDQVPFKLLLTKTKAPAAKQINTALKKNSATGPPWSLAFRLTTAERSNTKGTFYVARIALVDANPDHVAVAQNLAEQIAGSVSVDAGPAAEQPAI